MCLTVVLLIPHNSSIGSAQLSVAQRSTAPSDGVRDVDIDLNVEAGSEDL